MIRAISILIVASMTLTGCGSVRDSAFNPFNWFGRSKTEVVEADRNPLIPTRRGIIRRPDAVYAGTPIDRVTDVTVERIPGGAIVRATGVAAQQGPYQARLSEVEGNENKATLAYTFDVVAHPRATRGGSEASRRVTVATYLNDRELAGIRTIRVIGARNAQASRRR